MGKFNWWRRYRPKNKLQRKDALKGRPFLLQQIEHGDFDHSDFKRQAEDELKRCQKDLDTFVKNYKGNSPKEDSRYLDIERKYRKRYNKLMEDYHWEEMSMLIDLKQALIKEFEVDVWDDVMNEAMKRDISGGVSLYFLYSEISEKQLQQV
jgi:hypothetical protein